LLYFYKDIIFVILLELLEKNKYSLLPYESTKYLLSIPIILIKIKLFLIKIL